MDQTGQYLTPPATAKGLEGGISKVGPENVMSVLTGVFRCFFLIQKREAGSVHSYKLKLKPKFSFHPLVCNETKLFQSYGHHAKTQRFPSDAWINRQNRTEIEIIPDAPVTRHGGQFSPASWPVVGEPRSRRRSRCNDATATFFLSVYLCLTTVQHRCTFNTSCWNGGSEVVLSVRKSSTRPFLFVRINISIFFFNEQINFK